MPFDVADVPILSQGEMTDLMKAMPPDSHGTGDFQAWALGEPMTDPDRIRVALDIEARLSASDPKVADPIIDRALARLNRAFPEEATA